MGGRVDGWKNMDGRMSRRTEGWIDGRRDGSVDGGMGGWTDGKIWTDEWTDGRMDWVDGWIEKYGLMDGYLLPMRMGTTATQLQALTTYPIILNLRRQKQYAVEVNVHGHEDMGGKEDNPEDHMVETFLRNIAANLLKEPGTEISKTPVTVTLYGKPSFLVPDSLR
ncbi:hypothetical protein QZH41_014443 [Actinostola sp. cb2023]|nr:hypothetical protein QZH41_014443 [Actinostola sp. cb2023]